ncbi:Inner membrane transport protein yajR [Kingella potus]|uniref:Inner membrane transport protein yajR n=1 Tax=Kingella potus TaxID=265175 RepID=A0A377QZI7_9NEIS|nr:MFS transporter [Kingella potus]STR00834.1 Inner membrane transport protein yajR [Kingella potus]
MARAEQTQMSPEEWRASTSLSGVYALRMLGMFLVLPVLSLYAAGLPGAQHNAALAGFAAGIYGLTQALMQLPLGMASDRFGRKKTIYFGLILFAAGSFTAAAADTWAMLALGRALQGAGAVSAAVTALLADLTRDEVRTRSMAMIGLSIGITFSASLVLSPMLTGLIGVKGLFLLTGILTLASILVVAFLTPDPQVSKLHEDAQAQPSRLAEVFANRRLMTLNFGIFALHCGMMAIFASLPFVMENIGLDKTGHWKVYFPATLTGLILMIPAIIVGETRGRLKQVFVAGIALTAAAVLLLLFSLESLWLITACLTVYFVGFNILEASQPSMVSKIAPADLKGTAMGVYNTLQSVGLMSGFWIGGWLYQHYGMYAVLAFVAALTLVWLAAAAASPAPKPVKNIALRIGKTWLGRQEALRYALGGVAGIEQISFSGDGETVYIKALQKGFDEAAAKTIISGE